MTKRYERIARIKLVTRKEHGAQNLLLTAEFQLDKNRKKLKKTKENYMQGINRFFSISVGTFLLYF